MGSPAWKGTLTYGDVSFPVKLLTAARSRSVSFKQLRRADLSPVKEVKVAQADGEILSAEDIVKGYEVAKGDYLVFSDEEIAAANPATPHFLDVFHFTDVGKIKSLWIESSYYLNPDDGAERAYSILLIALRKLSMVGVTAVAISTRQRPAIVCPGTNGLLLYTLYYAHELRSLDEFRADLDNVSDLGIRASVRAIRSHYEEVDFSQILDRQYDNLLRLVEEKTAARKPKKKGSK